MNDDDSSYTSQAVYHGTHHHHQHPSIFDNTLLLWADLVGTLIHAWVDPMAVGGSDWVVPKKGSVEFLIALNKLIGQ